MIQSVLLLLVPFLPGDLSSTPVIHPPAEIGSTALPEDGRVILLGFDGADYRTTERMIAAGQLPNLKALAQQGTFAPLHSTNPAESAAGWAAINTGQNPVKNGVASFINRKFSGNTPVPGVAHITQDRNVSVEEFDIGGVLGFVVSHSALELALYGGFGAALVVFLLLGSKDNTCFFEE